MLVSALVGLTLPAAAVVIYVSLRPLWAAASDVEDLALPQTYKAIALRAVVFVLALQVLIILSVIGVNWLRPIAPRAVLVLFGLFLAAVGDALPRTRPNQLIGIRTARTLEDRQLWMRLHRIAGYFSVASGAAIAAAALLLSKDAIAWIVGMAALGSGGTLAIVYVIGGRESRITSAARTQRWHATALWTLRVLLALAFFYFGMTKFPGHGMWVRLFDRIGMGQGFRIFTGFVEMGGAVLLLLPRGIVPAAALLGSAMIGALLVHIFIVGVGVATIAVVTLLAMLIGVGLASRMS